MEELLQIEKIEKHYSGKCALKATDLTVVKGEFIALAGMSGGGKSTILRLIAGLEKPTAGEIMQDGQRVSGINRKIRMMFQDDRLLPWLNILQNVTLGPKKKELLEHAHKLVQQVELTDLEEAYPSQLSGGQKQRVALARALMARPEILLLDEPLGALDALTRSKMQDLIFNIWQQTGITMILVTHDIHEAVRLAQRSLVIQDATICEEFVNSTHGQTDEKSLHQEARLSAEILDSIMHN